MPGDLAVLNTDASDIVGQDCGEISVVSGSGVKHSTGVKQSIEGLEIRWHNQYIIILARNLSPKVKLGYSRPLPRE